MDDDIYDYEASEAETQKKLAENFQNEASNKLSKVILYSI